MKNEEMSILDAFCALSDIDETDLPKLREGKSFEMIDSKQVDAARKFREDTATDDTLEVIDINADDLEHVKDNKEYLGQVILSCKKCHAKKFIDMDKLVASDNNSDLYNLEDECPNCHSVGEGYVIEGQVGKFSPDAIEPEAVDQEVVPEEEKEPEPLPAAEETTDTDEPLSDLPPLETSEEEIEPEEAPEEEPQEEPEVDNSVDDDEKDGMETDSEDVEETESTLGEPYKEDLEDEDQGESYFKDFDSLPENGFNDDDLWDEPKEEEPKKKIKLRFKEGFEKGIKTFSDLLEWISEPEKINTVVVKNDLGDVIYDGEFSELPHEIISADIERWGGDDTVLCVNIDSDLDSYDRYNSFADVFDKCASDCSITVYDESSDDIDTLDAKKAIEYYADAAVLGIETPKVISIVVENNIKPYTQESKEENGLEEAIFKLHGLSARKINNPRCDEYWIHESLENEEDLDVLYEHYIRGTSLEKQFKRETGYRDAVDEAVDMSETAKRNDDMEAAVAKAKEILKSQKAYSVIYGYYKNGSNYALDEPLVCRDNKEHELAANYVNARFHAYTVSAVYGNISEQLDITTASATKIESDENSTIIKSEDSKINVESSDGANVQVNNDGSVEIRKGITEPELDDEQIDEEPVEEPSSEEEAPIKEVPENEEIDDEAKIESSTEDEPTDEGPYAEERGAAENESPKDESITSVKDRTELREFIKENKLNNRPYKIRRSLKEGYRYDIITEGELSKLDDEQEIIDPVKSDSTEVTTMDLSEEDRKFLDKIYEVAKNISDTIQKYYKIEADPRLIVVDIIQDLQLISGKIKPETLEKTPINNITKEMFKSYNEFYETFDQIYSMLTGEYVETTSDKKLAQALKMLDSPMFDKGHIEKALTSDRFLTQMRAGQIPYVNTKQLTEEFEEECPECEEEPCECEEIDVEKFDEEINQYFAEEYDDPVAYTTTGGCIDSHGNILLEGVVRSEESESNINFTLAPSKKLSEGIEKVTYKVTNNLSEELFEFEF